MPPEALEDVRTALAAEDWSRALPVALTAWRGERSSELADLIDRITARCELPQPPHTRSAIHRWWMANAIAPDPRMIGALLATFPHRMYVVDVPWEIIRTRWSTPNPVIEAVATLNPPRYLVSWAEHAGKPLVWDRKVPNWVERVAAIMTWPDDPRIARVLATLLTDSYAMIESDPGDGPWPVIANKLRALGDRRIGPLLARRVEQHNLTSRQRTLKALRDEVIAPAAASPEVAAIAASVPATITLPDPQNELASLWAEVAEHREDDGPRLVLADALLAAGDNRGELIVLQCAAEDERSRHANAQAARLIKREWERWMGDLALVLARRGTEIRRGMLHAIRVGLHSTPTWAWEAIHGHRELGCVERVRPAMVQPIAFAKLVASFPRFPKMLEIDAHEVLSTLLATHEHQPIEEIYYAPISNHVNYRRVRPLAAEVFRMMATLAPDLRRLDLGHLWWHGGEFRAEVHPHSYYVELVSTIRALFPRLEAIRIEKASIREGPRAALEQIAGITWLDTRLAL